jgi:double-stranded uracil-DNA glycosylase
VRTSGPAGATVPWRPTRDQIAAARGAKVPDVLAPHLAVLFVGINPGLYSGAVGHHFARPGNRFWKALRLAGFTDRVLSPFEEEQLLDRGVGITNLVDRATAGADELTPEELRRGARRLERKVCRDEPRFVAFLGLGAYRTAFGQGGADVGPQPGQMCRSRVWLLPNPSGLNAHYQIEDLARTFGELHGAAIPVG